MFETKGTVQPMDYVHFDMPQIFAKTKPGFDLMFALEACDKIEIFSHPSIQMLVRCHWNIWRKKNFWFHGFSLMLTLMIVSVWSNIILVHKEMVSETVLNFFAVAIVSLASYSFVINIMVYVRMSVGDKKENYRASHLAYTLLHTIGPLLRIFCVMYERFVGSD